MLRCIRFGEVLLDETFRTFLICNQCQTEFVEIPEFRVHLATSACGKRLFKDDVFALKFGAAQVTRGSKDKTYLLYNPADVQIATTEPVIHNTTSTPTDGGDDAYLDLIKIEEELLDPRWYTDIGNAEVDSPQHTASLQTAGISNKPMEYKELVEAVGPYVQFKDGANKGKQNVVLRRFSNKVNKPVMAAPVAPAAPPNPAGIGASPKNSILPAKRESNHNKPAARLLNPAAKRKLDLTPKQVHFKDEVNVKYVINETSSNTTANKRTRSLGNENTEKSSGGDGAILKRRKTITIPMDHINIHPDFQEQFGKGCSEVTKATENISTNAAVIKKQITDVNVNKISKTNSLANAARKTNVRSASTKAAPNTNTAPKSDLQVKHTNLVPNPLVIQKQTNDINQQIKNDNLLVKNPITHSRSNLTSAKNEKPLQSAKPITTTNTKAPTLVNRTHASTAARLQQRPIPTTTKPPIVQPSSFPVANKKIPPALAPLSSNKISNPAALAAAKKPPTDVQKQTNDILSKLQTRGLQVKRTQPPIPPQATVVIAAGEQQNKTMELLQKLQSKGMKVKILNGKEPTYAPGTAVTHTNVSINLPITGETTKMMNNMGNVRNGATENKTILNNKLIIKKVK